MRIPARDDTLVLMRWRRNRDGLGGGGLAALLAVLAVLAAGASCPRRPPLEPPPLPMDASSLVSRLEARGLEVERMEAALEARLSGMGHPYRGTFYGSLVMERAAGRLKIWLQVYSLTGLPALELISDGPRVQVFSPLDNVMFMNFTELFSGREYEEFPFASLSEVSLPLSLILEQIGLIMDAGLGAAADYTLSEASGELTLTEWEGGALRREITYQGPELLLKEVKVYQSGLLAGRMECSDHEGGYGPGGWIPRRVVLHEGEIRIGLKLSRLRLNREVSADEISFRQPSPRQRLILLTPPSP